MKKGPGKRGHIVADTNVSPFTRARNICCGQNFCVRDTKNVSDFVQKHFVPATNVSQFAQHGSTTFILCPACLRAQETSWATVCPQQCVLVCQGLYCARKFTRHVMHESACWLIKWTKIGQMAIALMFHSKNSPWGNILVLFLNS